METGVETIRNKVAESGILTLDLAPFIPAENSLAFFDLKPFLFMEMILREKDYRAALQAQDWSAFSGKHVALGCSTDAVIPVWAYMLAAAYLQPVAASVHFSSLEDMPALAMTATIAGLDVSEYTGKRVVLKGCGEVAVPAEAYVAAAARLRPVVKSLMYGEPCSTVPVYKAKPGA
ncbi:MAG: DUF2480 family protein [Bacteroidetes bacterium]|nr:DUF2480 family protein [Bacteroidota bacterium]